MATKCIHCPNELKDKENLIEETLIRELDGGRRYELGILARYFIDPKRNLAIIVIFIFIK